MFIGSRHAYSERPEFCPYHIQGLEIWVGDKTKFPTHIGDKLNHASCIDVFYYGELGGILLKLIARGSLTETLSIDLTNSCEIKTCENYAAPTFNCVGGLPVGKGPYSFRATIDYKNNTIEAEFNDQPSIYADEQNMEIDFVNGYYSHDCFDFEFLSNWTGRKGDLIIYSHRLNCDLAEQVESYLKNKWSFKHEEKNLT